MAQTTVSIDSDFIATPNDVAIVQGDTLTITSDASATLFFSHDCQTLLSPAPGASATIEPDDTLSFTFTTAHPGSYMVAVAEDPNAHAHFLPLKTNHLAFTTLIHSVRMGGSPNNQLQGQ